MEPQMLVEQASAAGVPAPMWFVEFFKVLGFTLHAVPMNLWYAGLLIALWLHLRDYCDVLAQPTDVQWSPLVMFLVVFVLGLGVIGWMLAQLRRHDA